MNVSFAPVLLFTYKRLDVLKKTVDALTDNYLVNETELFVFSDGPKNEIENEKIESIRNYIKTIGGFKNTYLIESSENKGLAKSIIDGVSQVFEKYDRVIVL